MTDVNVRQLVQRELGAVSVWLYDGITTGFGNARSSWSRLDRVDHRWLLSMNARARMREFWESNPVGDGWRLAGNPALMGQTLLCSPDERLVLRLLKENHAVHPGGVPYAGTTRARQQAWRQDPLPDMSLALPYATTQSPTQCLLLWDCTWEDNTPRLSARVVHTVGPGSYGVRVPIDLSFAIEPSGEMFEHREFGGDPQDEDLFPNIDRRDNEGNASGQ